MRYTKSDYRSAQAAASEALSKLKATPEYKHHELAKDRLEAIKDELGDVYICEGCSEPIFDGDPICSDYEEDIHTCLECSPTWAQFQAMPEDFHRTIDGERVSCTPEIAAALIAEHLNSGGTLEDSMATPCSMGTQP